MKYYMAIGNKGTTIHSMKSPLQGILDHMGRKHADKVYRDDPDTGKALHTGYIVGGECFDIFEVTPWKGRMK